MVVDLNFMLLPQPQHFSSAQIDMVHPGLPCKHVRQLQRREVFCAPLKDVANNSVMRLALSLLFHVIKNGFHIIESFVGLAVSIHDYVNRLSVSLIPIASVYIGHKLLECEIKRIPMHVVYAATSHDCPILHN